MKKSNFFIPKVCTNLGKTAISVAGPRVWTEVPKELKTLTKYKFKKLYHHHLVINMCNSRALDMNNNCIYWT